MENLWPPLTASKYSANMLEMSEVQFTIQIDPYTHCWKQIAQVWHVWAFLSLEICWGLWRLAVETFMFGVRHTKKENSTSMQKSWDKLWWKALSHTSEGNFAPWKSEPQKLRLSAFEQVERLSETKTKGGAQQLNMRDFEWGRKTYERLMCWWVKCEIASQTFRRDWKVENLFKCSSRNDFISSISLDNVVKKKFCVSKEN